MKDLLNNIDIKRVISPVSVADNTPQVGQIIDGQLAGSITYIVEAGAIGTAGAAFSVLLDESDSADMSGASAVAAVDLIGTLAQAGFTGATPNVCRKVGYKGIKRYTRLTITPGGNASAALLSAQVLLGSVPNKPTPNPPV